MSCSKTHMKRRNPSMEPYRICSVESWCVQGEEPPAQSRLPLQACANPGNRLWFCAIEQTQGLHGRVAGCLERLAPERVNEIGRHFLEARQEERALPGYPIKAADSAARTGGREEASTYYRRAIDIVQKVEEPEMARRAYEGLGKMLEFGMNVPGVLETYSAMRVYGQERNIIPIQVSALNKLSLVEAMMLGQLPQAEGHLAEAVGAGPAERRGVGADRALYGALQRVHGYGRLRQRQQVSD